MYDLSQGQPGRQCKYKNRKQLSFNLPQKLMTYSDYKRAFSQPRLERFLLATKGDQQKALHLYKLNIQLSECLFGIMSIFEIVLRNHIDQYYRQYFKDNEWLKNGCGQGGLFSHPSFIRSGFESRTKILTTIAQLGNHYTHDRLVAKLNFGFWTYMFTPIQFRVGGQGLHRIYINRPKGTSQSQLFNELDEVRSLRNRIAHHEPVCFDNAHQIYTGRTKTTHSYIIKHIEWLGYKSSELLLGLDETAQILIEIDQQK